MVIFKVLEKRVFGFLRLVLSMAVVFAHLNSGFNQGSFAAMIGAVPVVIFFILSGFVVSRILEKVNYKLSKFYLERMIRIFPLY